jgi:outer membrane lipoprotein-sorting protein
MNCLPIEQLVRFALDSSAARRPDDFTAARDHVRRCPACAAALTDVEAHLSLVAEAHDWFKRDHAAARERLLAALATVRVEQRVRPWQDGHQRPRRVFTMRRMWIGSAAAAALVGLILVWAATGPVSALAETAKALREVKSYQCRMTGVPAQADEKERADKEKETFLFCWAAPGSFRLENYKDGKLVLVGIQPKDKPGLEINHKDETFNRTEPIRCEASPLFLPMELAKFSGHADRELPKRKIDGKTARGFEIASSKIDPDRDDLTVRVWTDPETKLPLQVEMEVPGDFTMIFQDFAWDVPTDKWFDTEPPANYKDETPAPPKVEEETEEIVRGLKTYAKYCGGKYPQVKFVYGDVTSENLFRSAGFSSSRRLPANPEDIKKDEYVECSRARLGYAHLCCIQMHNPDAAYHGKTVGPEDKEKVLFRWKLATGEYRVIFGDLRAETVTADELKERERR